jgi:hypothetical protein
VRDQNHVVRGKNWRLIGWVFFNVFEKKVLKGNKAKMANKDLFVFFKKKKETQSRIKLINVWLRK